MAPVAFQRSAIDITAVELADCTRSILLSVASIYLGVEDPTGTDT